MVLRSNCIPWKFVFSDYGMWLCVCVSSFPQFLFWKHHLPVWIRLTPENSLPLFCWKIDDISDFCYILGLPVLQPIVLFVTQILKTFKVVINMRLLGEWLYFETTRQNSFISKPCFYEILLGSRFTVTL